MGIVNQGVPRETALFIQNQFQVQTFLETGTYFGETAFWASTQFEHVITIEYALPIYMKALSKYGTIQNISFFFGDSRELLSKLVPKLDEPALFWLDGHYSGQNTYGKDDECPILDELNTFHATSVEHFLMIDDARLFLAPPPYPHVHEQWPTIVEIIQLLLSINGTYYVTVIDDVIFAIPKYGKDIMTSYFQEQATRNWKAHLAITRERQNLVTQGNQQKSIKFLVNQLLKKPIK